MIPAAYAAIDDVNAKCDLLRNYSLQLDFVNTRVCTRASETMKGYCSEGTSKDLSPTLINPTEGIGTYLCLHLLSWANKSNVL